MNDTTKPALEHTAPAPKPQRIGLLWDFLQEGVDAMDNGARGFPASWGMSHLIVALGARWGVECRILPREHVASAPEPLCEDEGCPHHGTDHVCYNEAEDRKTLTAAAGLLAGHGHANSSRALMRFLRDKMRADPQPLEDAARLMFIFGQSSGRRLVHEDSVNLQALANRVMSGEKLSLDTIRELIDADRHALRAKGQEAV